MDICFAKEAMEIEHSIDALELQPGAIVPRAEGIVLVVADGESAGILDHTHGVGRDRGGLIHPNKVRSDDVNGFDKAAIDG